MKTLKKVSAKQTTKLVTFVLFLTLLFSGVQTNAQILVKGVVKGKTATETEVLNGANIYLKGTAIGTSSNKKGEFTFPRKLKIGDVLVFTYLGYEKKFVKINNDATNLAITLLEDANEMLGALNTNKRFKSKRKQGN
ncbi:carboxypeptidase-like regulatory domain-containing protein [uncultured Polaribacter sp.]|uniref:carboxypeptidase-like regulatory domain-containing protein n=1 Tax=uncultured Polaribacter sp. TaxID=174711 RepID=UPI002635AAD3|nr:carboxypeptidase-like regulatory domain-containing protein [uncultured Polaribacter sp.]